MALNRATIYGHVSRWLVHDLRNPSQTLTLVSELMHEESGQDDEPAEETIRTATRHLVRSLKLLGHTLRVPAAPPEAGPVSLREIMEFLGALHQAQHSTVELDLTSVLSQSLPAVAGVNDQLEHALLNILMNGLEACADRQDGTIMVTASADTVQVRLDFADNGSAVAPALRAQLFEPFVTSKPRPLSGLGLFVARELLARSGGSVEYEPAPSTGSRFIVILQNWR
ncbi:MAG: HAMP domain-containing sensor histidine kinase [Gemmatimonadales bacterium]